MGRNNPKNIKAHNDKLHKEQAKEKAKKNARAEKLKEIQRKFNENSTKLNRNLCRVAIAEISFLFKTVANLTLKELQMFQLPKN